MDTLKVFVSFNPNFVYKVVYDTTISEFAKVSSIL